MTTSASLVGTKLGNYELQALLGRGGMASVYQGFDLNLRRQVAIKVLSAATVAQPDFVERFRQEARLIANLRHPNIVHVYDFGEQADYIYMVQELLPGPTLEQRLDTLAARGQRLAREDVLTIVAQLAAALDAAHAAGIIHRDIKPANALWNAGGELVLTDFGIAKNLLGAAGHTQVGVVIGTPDYLSPEQAQGLPLTPASDIYALGIVLYELISGQTPFGGATPMHVVFDHIQTPPPPLRSVRPDLAPAVEAVVLRALAKDPAQRFGSAGDMARALGRAWPAQPALNPPPAGVHDQATTVWERPKPSAPTPVSVRPAPPASPPPAPRQPVTAPPAPAPERGRKSAVLPVLAGLLLLLLIGGAALALRGSGANTGTIEPAPTPPLAQATAAPEPAAAPEPTLPPATAAPEPPAPPTAPPEPDATRVIEPTSPAPPTAPPEPTATPVTEPTPPPPTAAPEPTAPPTPTAVPDDPVAQLRVLFVAAAADGRAGEDGDGLIRRLDEVQEALNNDDTKRAEARLRDLRKEVIDDERDGDIDSDFAAQALDGIKNIADRYDLKLPSGGEGTDD